LVLNPGQTCPKARMRRAIKHTAAGEDAEAEELLWGCLRDTRPRHQSYTSTRVEADLKPHTVLAELLERRGTEEALAEARTLRDEVAHQLATHEVRRAAALEETRAAAAEEVRQWREERIKAREKKGGRGKCKKKGGKKKGRRGKANGKEAPSAAAAIEGGQPYEPAGGEADEAAAAEAEQQAQQVEETQPQGEGEKDEEREECAICLQELELEDDDGEEEALVVLTCGHRFHEI
jgi:hypothetical protein